MKNTVVGIVVLGAMGSLLASQIEKYATVEEGASRIENFFLSTITIPSWSLLAILVLLVAMVCICFLIHNLYKHKIEQFKREFNDENNRSDFINEVDPAQIQLKEKKFSIAKHMVRIVSEESPRQSEDILNILANKNICEPHLAEEVLSDLVHYKILEKYSLGGLQLKFGYESSLKTYFQP